MIEKLRVGVIGRTGKGDYGHGIDTVWAEIQRAQVVAVADEDEAGRNQARERTGAAKAYADYRQMLDEEKLDLVAIAPRWIDCHHTLLMAAADHGCHVYMEKPFCRNLLEADEVVNAFEMRHLKLAIAHQTRWTPALAVAREEVKNGLIGKILELRGRGKEDAKRGGGEDLWVLGSHVLDLMRAFAGDPTSCQALVLNQGKPATLSDVAPGNEGIGPLTGDAIQATYRLPNNATGFFASQRGAGTAPSRFGIQVFGTEGVLEFLTGFPGECWVLRDPAWSPGRTSKNWMRLSSNGVDQPETLPNTGLHGGNIVAVENLIDCIESPEKQPLCSMYDARWTIEMITAVFASHLNGQAPVELPLKSRKPPL